jgi:hypothetical protein
MLTIMGEKVKPSHLMQKWKDGAIYKKVPEELPLGGFCREKNLNMLAFFLH